MRAIRRLEWQRWLSPRWDLFSIVASAGPVDPLKSGLSEEWYADDNEI
jgi:hypothetical protein